jgi:hypothetical protein
VSQYRLLALSFALGGCFGVSGSGERERETRAYSDFEAIENKGELSVQVRRADEFRVVVSIDANLLDNVKTRVRDNTLVIDTNVNLLDTVPGPHVIVDMPELRAVQLLGSGDLSADGFDDAQSLRFEQRGSGDLRFDGAATRIDATLSGSGDLQLIGTADFLELEVRGSGDVDARDLVAAGGRFQVDGSGNIAATIHGEVDAEVNGSGDVNLYGDVDLVRSDEDGSGDIVVH